MGTRQGAGPAEHRHSPGRVPTGSPHSPERPQHEVERGQRRQSAQHINRPPQHRQPRPQRRPGPGLLLRPRLRIVPCGHPRWLRAVPRVGDGGAAEVRDEEEKEEEEEEEAARHGRAGQRSGSGGRRKAPGRCARHRPRPGPAEPLAGSGAAPFRAPLTEPPRGSDILPSGLSLSPRAMLSPRRGRHFSLAATPPPSRTPFSAQGHPSFLPQGRHCPQSLRTLIPPSEPPFPPQGCLSSLKATISP